MTDLYTMLFSDSFNQSLATVYYFYGLGQSRFTPEVVGIKDAYVESEQYNFVLVSLPDKYYTTSVSLKIVQVVITTESLSFLRRMRKSSAAMSQ